jgi:hypothetical protein
MRRRAGVLTMQARGTFEVKLTPQASSGADSALGQLTMAKQFHGDL